MDRTIGVAVVGTGWSATQHIAAFIKNSRTSLRYIVARDVQRARASLDKSGIAPGAAAITTSYDEALAAADVDIVAIATPNHLHARQAVAAAQAGKHMVLEKPTGL